MHDPQTIELVLSAVVACALVLQTIFMIVIATIVIKAVRSMREELENYRSAVTPVIEKTRDVVENVGPKVEKLADDLTALTKSLSKQAVDIQAAANDVIDVTRRQASRVDGMLTTIFDRLEHAGVVMSEAVAKPMRQVSGVIASIKAAIETLRNPEAGQQQAPMPMPPRYAESESIASARPTGTATPLRP